MIVSSVPAAPPQEVLLRDLLARVLGWRHASGAPQELEIGGRRYRVTPLAERHPAVALLCEPLPGTPFPDYRLRRRLRGRLRRLFPRHLAVYTDAAHTVQVWSWEDREAGGAAVARELGRLPDRPGEEWPRRLRSIARQVEGRGPTAPAALPAAPEVLVALLRRVRRSHPRAFARGGLPDGSPAAGRGTAAARVRTLRTRARRVMEATDDPDRLRALWRALSGLTVLDPACGTGGWLLSVMGELEPIYGMCLDRMQGWVEEADRGRPRARRSRLSDFRAILERADDTLQHPTRGHFVRESIALLTLHGADRDPEALETAELRIALRLAPPLDAPAAAVPPTALPGTLRVGDPDAGFPSLDALQEALRAGGEGARLPELVEEAETLDRAERRLCTLRLAQGFPAERVLDGHAGVERRREALRAAVDALLARREGIDASDAGAFSAWRAERRPLHRCMEYPGIRRRGGFSAERRREG